MAEGHHERDQEPPVVPQEPAAELKEEARAAYYSRRGGADHSSRAGAVAGSNANGVAYSAQSVEEIMRIVQEAQTVPKPARPVSGYGWGAADSASDDDNEQLEQYDDEEEQEEDDYDRTVRQVHASGEFDMAKLQI